MFLPVPGLVTSVTMASLPVSFIAFNMTHTITDPSPSETVLSDIIDTTTTTKMCRECNLMLRGCYLQSLSRMVTVASLLPSITLLELTAKYTVKVSFPSRTSSSMVVMLIHCVLLLVEPAGNIIGENTGR